MSVRLTDRDLPALMKFNSWQPVQHMIIPGHHVVKVTDTGTHRLIVLDNGSRVRTIQSMDEIVTGL